jgi:hypothetical protein
MGDTWQRKEAISRVDRENGKRRRNSVNPGFSLVFNNSRSHPYYCRVKFYQIRLGTVDSWEIGSK